jgi:hypothetical protein
VKAGTGKDVNSLLQNEANWLRTLGDQAEFVDHIPTLVAYYCEGDLAFVAECMVLGKIDLTFGKLHVAFLRKFQKYSRKTMHFQDSRICQNLHSRVKDLGSLLSSAWSARLGLGLRQIEESLTNKELLLVAVHNDFTPWNIRVAKDVVRVFDWEYAESEHLPLFDPLHFMLMPMALSCRSKTRMLKSMKDVLQQCHEWFGSEFCFNARAQALAYLMNICTLYLWSDRAESESHPVLNSYGAIIDHLCHF